MSNFKIYPEIDIQEFQEIIGGHKYTHLQLNTYLRKKHNGTWYFWIYNLRTRFKDYTSENKELAINKLHKEIYYALILGKIDEKLNSHYKETVYPKDSNQISEKKRIKQLLKQNKSWQN